MSEKEQQEIQSDLEKLGPCAEYEYIRTITEGVGHGKRVHVQMQTEGRLTPHRIAMWRFALATRTHFRILRTWFAEYKTLYGLWCARIAICAVMGYEVWCGRVKELGLALLVLKALPVFRSWAVEAIVAHAYDQIRRWDRRKHLRSQRPASTVRQRVLARLLKGVGAPLTYKTLYKHSITMADIPTDHVHYDTYMGYLWPNDTMVSVGKLLQRERGIEGTIVDIVRDPSGVAEPRVIVRWFYPDNPDATRYQVESHPYSHLKTFVLYYPRGEFNVRRLVKEINDIVTATPTTNNANRFLRLIDAQQKSLSRKTKAGYIQSIRLIGRLGGLDETSDLGDWIRDRADEAIAALKAQRPLSYANCCCPIVTIGRVNSSFQRWLTPAVFNLWVSTIQDGIAASIEWGEQRKANFRTINWEVYVDLVRSAYDFTKTPPFERLVYASDDYILLALYVERTLRDDYGGLKISRTDPRRERDYDTHNWIWVHHPHTVAIHLNLYKTFRTYKNVIFEIRDPYLRAAIVYRVHCSPERVYLLGEAGNDYAHRVAQTLFRYLGPTPQPMCATHLRKARVTYERRQQNGQMAREHLAQEMLHTVATADLYYNHHTAPFEVTPPPPDEQLLRLRASFLNQTLLYNGILYTVLRLYRAPHAIGSRIYAEIERVEMPPFGPPEGDLESLVKQVETIHSQRRTLNATRLRFR